MVPTVPAESHRHVAIEAQERSTRLQCEARISAVNDSLPLDPL